MNDDLHPLDDSIRNTLHGAADDLTVDLLPAGALARRGRMRRLRRRTLGLGAVGALTVGGVLIVTRGDDGSVQTADDTSVSSTVPLVADGEGDGDGVVVTPPPTLPPVDDPASEVGQSEPAETKFAADAASSFYAGPDGLYPWGEGFLSIRTEYVAQPLPELSDEITALFPQEVLDLFPDGLPPTIDEAIAVLTDAGMLDEVTAILSEHPEAMDAVYSAPPPPPNQIIEYSVDGVTWEPLDVDWPASPHYGMSVHDDTIVVWAMDDQEFGDYGLLPDSDGVRTLTVHTTTDLRTWTSDSVDIPLPTDPRDFVHGDVWVGNVVATDDGWFALAQSNRWIDELALLPEEVRAEIESGDGDFGYGYGYGLADDGIRFEHFDPDGEEWTVELFTWADLGIEPLDLEQIHSSTEATLLVNVDGRTDVRPAPSELGDIHQVYAAGGRLVAVGAQSVHVSDDGVDWTRLTGIPDQVWLAAVVPVEGGTLLVGELQSGPTGWLIDESGQLVELELPELPNRYIPQSASSSAAWIVELFDDTPVDWDPITIVVEHEGVSVALTDRPSGQSVVATDLATGDIVYQLDQDWDDESWQEIWEWDDGDEQGWIVLRGEGGVEIVRVPAELVNRAYDEQMPAATDESVEEWNPDFWLVATTNGLDWLVLDIDDPDPSDAGYWPSSAAINGDRVLYRTTAGWQLTTIG